MKNGFKSLFEPGDGLYQRTVRSAVWVFVLRIATQSLSFIKIVILARILAPHDFGLMGIAMLAMVTLETFSTTGLSAALIQKKGETKDYLNAAWTFSALRGFLLFIILIFAAPYVAIFFDTPIATPILRVIGVSALLAGFTNIGVIYLQKELEFNREFIYKFSGTLADFVVSISAALILRSVWALVLGLLASSIVNLIVSYFIHLYRPHFSLDLSKLKELFGFSKWLLGSSILMFLFFQGDDIFVGKIFGVTLLGFYQMAYRFSNAPATEITHVVSQVTFPVYSRLQDNVLRLREVYLKTLQLTAAISIPLAGGIFILAPEFTQLFLGDKWMPMVPALRILVLAGLLNSIGATAGSIFQGVGKPQINTKWQLIRLLVLAAAIYPFSLEWGILGTSAAVLLGLMLTTVAFSFMVIKMTECSFGIFTRRIAFPLTNTMVMILLIFGLKATLDTIGIVQFVLLIVAGILIYLSITCVLDKFFNYGMGSLVKEVVISLRKKSGG